MKVGRERPYPLTVLLYSAAYTSYFLSKLIFSILAMPLVLVLSPAPRIKDRVLRTLTCRYLGFFTRWWLPALGIYRLMEVAGADRARSQRPALYISNHRGFMDSILLLGLLPRTGVVVKSNYTRGVTYALLERHFDLVGINPSLLSSVAAAFDKCRRLLRGGKGLIFFPEGTRARTGRLQRFSRLPFDLAVATRTPVVPVVIHSTRPFMGRVPGSFFPRGRNEYRIRFLDPEPLRPEDGAEGLRDRVHRRMARELKTLDAGTFWEVNAEGSNEHKPPL